MKKNLKILSEKKPDNQYDFENLVSPCPELSSFVFKNQFGTQTIDFANPIAVKFLNRALLFSRYNITFWDIPEGYLCPPVPGRALYIENIANLLAVSLKGKIPTGGTIQILDIGTGANCIYPIIGHCA